MLWHGRFVPHGFHDLCGSSVGLAGALEVWAYDYVQKTYGLDYEDKNTVIESTNFVTFQTTIRAHLEVKFVYHFESMYFLSMTLNYYWGKRQLNESHEDHTERNETRLKKYETRSRGEKMMVRERGGLLSKVIRKCTHIENRKRRAHTKESQIEY